jgi:hypothetical protein
MMTVSMVTVVVNGRCPMSVVRPMAAVTQRLEAVVMPFTLSFSAQIVPAPMKPIPATMPAAILARSIAKLMETVVNRHEPSKTGMWVRQPTGLQAISRSMPTNAPNSTAKSNLESVLKVSLVCMTGDYDL